jgi:hypothetical protein
MQQTRVYVSDEEACIVKILQAGPLPGIARCPLPMVFLAHIWHIRMKVLSFMEAL